RLPRENANTTREALPGGIGSGCFAKECRAPPESDRIIGFTIPKGGSFYICDHDEVWKVTIRKTLGIEVTDHSPYEFLERSTDFLGLVFKGLTANAPLLHVGDSEVSYHFDPKSDFVRVNCKVHGRSAQIESF